MQAIEVGTVNDAFEWACDAVRLGKIVSPRNSTTLELDGPVAITVHDLQNNIVTNPFRKPNYAFGLAEILQIWSGDNRVDRVGYYNKRIRDYSDDGKTFYGAYGPPFRGQLDYVLQALRKDRDTRQAVITIWRQNPSSSKDIPCTVMMHFLIRDMLLDLIVYMRSNDIWLGFTYDAYVFTTLQKAIAANLGVSVGKYTHIAGSMHLYSADFWKSSWVSRYADRHLYCDLPILCVNDLDTLVAVENDLRAGLDIGDVFKIPDEASDYVKLHWTMLRAYHKKCEWPEPYRSLRLAGRQARNEVGGSNPDSAE